MSEYRSYTEQMTVLDGDSDFRRCLKPSALFRYVEQVSADHARAYGMVQSDWGKKIPRWFPNEASKIIMF